jgi:polyisoprenoid-binding protein YceI
MLWGIVFTIMCSAPMVLADPKTTYTIDPARSEFVVQLFKAGVGSALAHDHVVQATVFTGQIEIDLAAPTSGAITVDVQTAALKVDEPHIRQKYGLASQLSEKDRQQIQETMQSASQLDVAHYPVMKFSSTKIEAQSAGTYLVTGNLTIRGKTQIVNFPAQVEQQDKALHIKGDFRFTQSSFGYQPYSAFFGAVRNQDEVVLYFDAVAAP